MSSDLDKLNALKGKKVVDFDLRWDDLLDDFTLDSITFEDGSELIVWTTDGGPKFLIDDVE